MNWPGLMRAQVRHSLRKSRKMTEKDKGDVFGIAPAVAKRLVEWADEKRKLAAARQEKFDERDGVIDQIREAKLSLLDTSGDRKPISQKDLDSLKAECYDVLEEIKEYDRQIKYLTTQIDSTLCDPKKRSQEVTDPDVLGPVKAPAPEPKRHKDDGQQMLASADRPPSDGSESNDIMAIDEADTAKLADYNGVPNGEPATWLGRRWDVEPFGRKQKLDAEIGGKWFATTDQVGEVAIKAKLATPKALLDEVTIVYFGEGSKEWRREVIDFEVASFLVQEAARQHLREPSAAFRDFLAQFAKEGMFESLGLISPLARAIAEKDRDLKGTGDGTKDAPAGPQGGSAGQSKKREAAAKPKGGKGTKKAA